MELDIKTSIKPQPIKGYNLVAEISGTDPVLKNELVIIGGHFDSWHAATGATDNGAGSVVMMEVMRILKTLKLDMKRTVRIVLWGGEEQGLLGSLAYVNKNVAEFSTMKPLRDYDRISAYYNLDNGSGKIRGIHLQNNEALRPIFKQWLEPFKDLEATTVSIKNSGYTDNESFDLVGIPGFQFIQDELNYETRAHHTNADTYDQLSEDDMKQASTIIASLVYNTANRKEKLPRKPTPKPYGNFNFYLLQ
jgi:Zn-dependent M28 family amino/carboxypeptidase